METTSIGEPWITYFESSLLVNELRRIGFKDVKDLGPKDANERYFKERTDGLLVAGNSHS